MSALGILLLELAGLFTLYLGFFQISSVYMNFFRKIFKASDILQTKYSWWFFFLLRHVITYIGFCGAAYQLDSHADCRNCLASLLHNLRQNRYKKHILSAKIEKWGIIMPFTKRKDKSLSSFLCRKSGTLILTLYNNRRI